tara:strand:- start:292 stop:528 length:237 start_codon:yes stop_codon:yes gene_type:complete
MIIPICCYTCGKIIADKWKFYETELKKIKKDEEDSILNVNSKTVIKYPEGEILDKLGLKDYCCRRMMLSHVDLIKDIN